jgi:hypothetical protein
VFMLVGKHPARQATDTSFQSDNALNEVAFILNCFGEESVFVVLVES